MDHSWGWAIADVPLGQQLFPECVGGDITFKEGHAGWCVLTTRSGGIAFVATAELGLSVKPIAADPRDPSAAGVPALSPT